MNVMKKIFLVLVCCVVAGCDFSGQQAKNVGKYAPVFNAKPKYYLAVKGKVAKILLDHVKIAYVATYYAQNNKCDITTNALEGVRTPRALHFSYPVITDGRGLYEQKIPLDKVHAGLCKWNLVAIDYKINDHSKRNNGTTIAFFNVGRVVKSSTVGGALLQCDKHGVCRQLFVLPLAKHSNDTISAHKNYSYALNINSE